MVRRSDYVLVMERGHLEDVRELCADASVAGAACPENVHLLGSFLTADGKDVQDIPDPYFGDLQCFIAVHELIDSALSGFLACIEERLENSR